MYISTALSHKELSAIMTRVSDDYYGGYLTFELEDLNGVRRNRFRFKMGATSGKPGSRKSASGRRGPWACWDSFRDVLAAIFIADPNALIRTGMATYRNAPDCLDKYQETGDRNVGSRVSPAFYDELCDCDPYAPDFLIIELRETLENRANLTV